jgi:hypothetical protein
MRLSINSVLLKQYRICHLFNCYWKDCWWNTRSGFIFRVILFSIGVGKGYLSIPRYFFASLSVCSTAPSLVCSITLPLINTILYGLSASDIEIATLGSLDTFLCFILHSTVLIKILLLFSSRSIHVGVTWGEPSFMSVDRWAKFFPLSNWITGSVIWSIMINSIIIVQSVSNNVSIFKYWHTV